MRTSAASRSALCASLNPRWASTMARYASSGLAKFERVDNAMETSVVAGGARQGGVECCSCWMAKTCGDIPVGAQQIGGARLGIVACSRKPRGIGKAVLATDTNHADAIGRIGYRAVHKFKQGEPRSAFYEGVGHIQGSAGRRGGGRCGRRVPGPRDSAPRVAIRG